VAFIAVLLDRPAITLRGLALAAAVVLAIRPVSLMDVGFQMIRHYPISARLNTSQN